LARWPSRFRHVLCHRGLADIDPELEQFTMNTGAPQKGFAMLIWRIPLASPRERARGTDITSGPLYRCELTSMRRLATSLMGLIQTHAPQQRGRFIRSPRRRGPNNAGGTEMHNMPGSASAAATIRMCPWCSAIPSTRAEQVILTVVGLLAATSKKRLHAGHDRLRSASRIRLATKSRNVRTRADKCRPPR
jgi:hypothetical protein